MWPLRVVRAHSCVDASSINGRMSVFATVGTTQFDELIRTLLSDEILAALAKQGYHTLRLQVGRGADPPVPPNSPLTIDW